MRIAYCFSGYLRRFWSNTSLLDHVIRRTPGDVYVHTWDTLNYAGATWHGDTGLSSVAVDSHVLERLTTQYGPIARLVVERPPQFAAALMPAIQGRYSIWRANELKADVEREHGFRYDLVVNLRFDLVAHEPYDFPQVIDPDALYCLANRNCVTQHLCCDLLNFGSSDTMNAVAELYQAMQAGLVSEANANSGERFLTQWCTARTIAVRYVGTPCSILRSDGSMLEIPYDPMLSAPAGAGVLR